VAGVLPDPQGAMPLLTRYVAFKPWIPLQFPLRIMSTTRQNRTSAYHFVS
jgi:hypothetical protein